MPIAVSISTQIASRRFSLRASSIWVSSVATRCAWPAPDALGITRVQVLPGLLNHVDDVAVAVGGVEAVDPPRHRAAGPVELLKRPDPVGPRLLLVSGATASSRSSITMSAPSVAAFSSIRMFEPGTANSERCRRSRFELAERQ